MGVKRRLLLGFGNFMGRGSGKQCPTDTNRNNQSVPGSYDSAKQWYRSGSRRQKILFWFGLLKRLCFSRNQVNCLDWVIPVQCFIFVSFLSLPIPSKKEGGYWCQALQFRVFLGRNCSGREEIEAILNEDARCSTSLRTSQSIGMGWWGEGAGCQRKKKSEKKPPEKTISCEPRARGAKVESTDVDCATKLQLATPDNLLGWLSYRKASVSGWTGLGKKVNIVTRVVKRKLGSRVYARLFPRKAKSRDEKKKDKERWKNGAGMGKRRSQ